MSQIQIDPEFKSLIPPLSNDEYQQLEANMKSEGCRDPLVTWQGVIIDGHNRFEICNRHGIGFEKISKSFSDRSGAIEWIIRNQFGRRNLDGYQRTKLALRLEEMIAARAKAHQSLSEGRGQKGSQKSADLLAPIETREEIAKLAGVSRDTVDKVKQIERKAAPEVKAALAKGEISINKAHQTVKTPRPEPEPMDDPAPVVVDGTKPVDFSRHKVIQTNGMAIFATAKQIMVTLNKNDSHWREALEAMISYCESRLKNKK